MNAPVVEAATDQSTVDVRFALVVAVEQLDIDCIAHMVADVPSAVQLLPSLEPRAQLKYQRAFFLQNSFYCLKCQESL